MIGVAAGILVIVLIVTWVWRARAATRLEAALMVAVAAAVVLFTWLQSPLSILFGPLWPGTFAALAGAGAARLARRSRSLPPRPARLSHRRIVVPALALGVMAFAIGLLLAARPAPADAVALAWPLRDGTFKVMHGGGSPLVNSHAGVPAQAYALDILAINNLGLRARGIAPPELDRYVIFNTPIHAPCAGEVIASRDGLSDTAGAMDRSQLAGNYAAIYCRGVTVLLAHVRSGTLEVKTGETVREGQLIGRVGNSGNSSEPHLHVHANRGRVADPIEMVTTAEGVPMTFSGRFLVRNDVVKS